MLDQGRVRSGFDVETMIGEGALTNVLSTLTEAGVVPATLAIERPPIDFRLREPTTIKRLYEPDPDIPLPDVSSLAFGVEILFDHPLGADLRVTIVFDYSNRITGRGFLLVPIDLLVRLPFTLKRDESGAISQASLQIDLVDIDSPVLGLLETDFEVTKADLLGILKEKVERTLDLAGVGAFKRIDDMAIRKLPADGEHPAAIGVYLNLILRTGPEVTDLLAARGDVEEALNLLPAGADSAFATRQGLYGDIARDAFQRRAERTKTGGFVYPLHKSPSNPDSKRIGTLSGITVGPLIPAGTPGVPPPPPTNILRIQAKGELDVIDTLFDPDFTLTVDLAPFVDDRGELQWSIGTDLSVDTLFEFLPFLLFSALSIVFGVAGLVASGIIAGALVGVDIAAGKIAAAVLSGKVEKKVDATLLDVMPDKLSLVQRRWDPFFTTIHQVVTRPQGVLVNEQGIALWGTAAVGRKALVVDHVVIRDEESDDAGAPIKLRYRVSDAADFVDELSAVAPATDRRPFSPPGVDDDQQLYELTVDAAVDRIAEQRLQANIPYLGTRIDLRQGQIAQLLVISERERNEVRGDLIALFRDATETQIRADQGGAIRQEVLDAFAAQGVTPTEDEIAEAVDKKLRVLIDVAQIDFEDTTLPLQLDEAVAAILGFDLPPEHLAALQAKGILSLSDLVHEGRLADTNLQIVELRKGHEPPLVYFRDAPRFADTKNDNLLTLPHYRHT